MNKDALQLSIVFSDVARKAAIKTANAHSDAALAAAIAAIPKALVYKGAVNYYADLPTEGVEVGHCYTVLYQGTSGTKKDGTEYAWGAYEGGYAWIPYGPDMEEIFAHIADGTIHVTAEDKAAWNGKIDKTMTATATGLDAGTPPTVNYDSGTNVMTFGIPKGDKGDTGATGPQGNTGATGPQGAAGKSAYASAQDGGYTGTEGQFNADLAGVSSKIGDAPSDGAQYARKNGAWATIQDSILPEITITTIAGATVTLRKDGVEKSYTVGSSGVLVVTAPALGDWTFTSSGSGDSITKLLTIDIVKQYTLDLPLYPIYGVEWNRTSSPVWSRTDAAELFTDPVPFVNNGMTGEDCSSPFDGIMPWAGMVRVTDPVAGELVAIPKFYYKWTVDATKMKLQISEKPHTGFHVSPAHMDRGDGKGERQTVYVGRYHCSTSNYKSETGVKPKASITRSTARTNIHNLGSDIWQLDHALWWTIDMLYLVEFANANCQDVIGWGRGNGSSTENMGYTDTMPYHTGTMKASKREYGVATQYRNIEGLWDNVVDWCDGIYFSGANVYHIINPDQFSDTANGTLTGTRATVDSKVITGFTFPSIEGFEWAGYPGSGDVGASGTTGADYFCDNEYYNANGVVLFVGGDYHQNQSYGLFFRSGSSTASDAYASIGARLQKLP